MNKTTFLVVAACVAIGCGDDDNGSSFNTTVPGNKPMNTLTPDEVTQMCNDTGRFVDAQATQMQQGSCRYAAAFATEANAMMSPTATDEQLQAFCSDMYGQCIAGVADGGAGTGSGIDVETCETPPPNCTATVAEYTACMTDMMNALNQAMADAPACDRITRGDLSTMFGDGGMGEPDAGTRAVSAACDTFNAKCPGVLD